MKSSNLIKTSMTVIAVIALSVGNAHAEKCPLVPDEAFSLDNIETAELLEDGQFAKAEAALEKQHRKNLASEGGDLLTVRDMVELRQLGLQDENLIRMRADQRPKSFFAQYNAGLFYFNQAGAARGSQTISQTHSSQLENMSKLNKTSIDYLQKAMKLDPRSALPHALLIGIAAREKQAAGKTAEQWLQTANQVDPKNLAARIQAVGFMDPRWGGSFELLDKMVEQARKPLSAQTAHYLQYNLVLAKAEHEEVVTGNKAKAHELYKKGKGMCENSTAAQKGIVRTYQK